MQHLAEKRAQTNERPGSNRRTLSPGPDPNATPGKEARPHNEQRGAKSELKVRRRRKQLAAFRLNGIALPD